MLDKSGLLGERGSFTVFYTLFSIISGFLLAGMEDKQKIHKLLKDARAATNQCATLDSVCVALPGLSLLARGQANHGFHTSEGDSTEWSVRCFILKFWQMHLCWIPVAPDSASRGDTDKLLQRSGLGLPQYGGDTVGLRETGC